MCRYGGPALRYWKPVQTGTDQDDDTAAVQRLSGMPDSVLNEGIRLPRPVSPHLAARLNGATIDVESLMAVPTAQSRDLAWIVEGAGGVLVPFSERVLQIEFMQRLELPVLIVARSGLGTINHTLLTIEALERRAVPIAGVIMVGAPDEENRRAIECFARVAVVGQLPMLEPLSPEALQRWAVDSLDAGGRLARFLG